VEPDPSSRFLARESAEPRDQLSQLRKRSWRLAGTGRDYQYRTKQRAHDSIGIE
jgi:hypothetical protein